MLMTLSSFPLERFYPIHSLNFSCKPHSAWESWEVEMNKIMTFLGFEMKTTEEIHHSIEFSSIDWWEWKTFVSLNFIIVSSFCIFFFLLLRASHSSLLLWQIAYLHWFSRDNCSMRKRAAMVYSIWFYSSRNPVDEFPSFFSSSQSSKSHWRRFGYCYSRHWHWSSEYSTSSFSMSSLMQLNNAFRLYLDTWLLSFSWHMNNVRNLIGTRKKRILCQSELARQDRGLEWWMIWNNTWACWIEEERKKKDFSNIFLHLMNSVERHPSFCFFLINHLGD